MSAVLRTLIFTILVPGFWTVAVPYWWLVRRGVRAEVRAAGAVGLLFVVCGTALYLICAFWGFALRGGGTPAPIDPPKKLVVQGPYGVVRNPMYWAVVSVMLGEAMIFRSHWLAELSVAFFAGTVLFVLVYEEPILRATFGAEYEEYCRRVPRWLPQWKTK